MSVKRTINFVTGNKNKLREVAGFLKENDAIEITNVDLDCMKSFYFIVSALITLLFPRKHQTLTIGQYPHFSLYCLLCSWRNLLLL